MFQLIGSLFVARTPWGQAIKTVLSLGSLVTLPIGIGLLLIPSLVSHGAQVYAERVAAKGAKEHGLTADYTIKGRAEVSLIDKTKRVILIANASVSTLIKFSDIESWDWQWVERNGHKNQNKIAFSVRDEKNPVVKMSLHDAALAEEWHQRLSVILNA